MSQLKLGDEVKQPIETCTHDWKTFKQSVIADNPQYSRGSSHFIVMACLKCKKKRYIDYKVDKQ